MLKDILEVSDTDACSIHVFATSQKPVIPHNVNIKWNLTAVMFLSKGILQWPCGAILK